MRTAYHQIDDNGRELPESVMCDRPHQASCGLIKQSLLKGLADLL